MSAVEVLSSLRARGVKLWVDGDRLQYRAPKGVVTDEVRADLARHKAEITAFLLEAAGRGRTARQRIPRVSREADLPLSFAQQRLWFLDQLAPGNPFYNEYLGVRFSFPVNAAVLQRCLNEIVRRHEALRTTFHAVDGQPVQRIAPALTIPLATVDLRDVAADALEREVVRLAAEEADRPFDLTTGPLLRATVVRLGESEYAFLLIMHHIVSDTWSMGVFFRELSALYAAFIMGRPSPLSELTVQYGDFAVWQRQLLQGRVRDEQLEYWRTQLASLPTLQLPTDRPAPAVQTFRGARHRFEIDASLSLAIKSLSQRHGVTLFMTLLAAFQTLLHRYTGQHDIVVGSFIAGRNSTETEDLIGFFINTQVLRTDYTGDPSFSELLSRVKEVAMGAYTNQDLPFEILVEELQPERDLSRNPLFQALFQLQNVPTTAAASSASNGVSVDIGRNTAIFDLVFHLWEGTERIGGVVEYSTDLFDASTIERMVAHFARLLEGVVARPSVAISALPLLTERERQQQIVGWNDTRADYPRDATIHQLFEEQAARTPEAIAVVYGDEEVSYGALNAGANRLAHYLRRAGVDRHRLVGVFLERSVDMVAALLAVLKAGAAYVPLDPAYPKDRLAFMLQDAAPAMVLTQARLSGRLPAQAGETVCVDDFPRLAEESETDLAHQPVEDAAAYIIYTSGSSGRPKGIVGLHRGAVNRFAWMWDTYPFATDEICCHKTSLSFVDSIWEIFGPLLRGVRVVLIPEEVVKQPDALVEDLARHGVTRITVVPSLLSAMLDVRPDLGACLSRLRNWITSGEAISWSLCERFFSAVPDGLLMNLYGSSEVSADATWTELHSRLEIQSVPIGRPIANTQAYILDHRLQPVPIGVAGELHIGGDGLARGYLNRPELSAQRFIPDPFSDSPAARLYKTGDLAKLLPDGTIIYLGRLDHQVKIRGFRIELEEIEAVLRQHPRVNEAAIAATDEVEGGKRLTAYLVGEYEAEGGVTAAHTSEVESEHEWQMVWDDTYARSGDLPDPTFNITGWNSVYSSMPIPADEMREWVNATVERLLSRRPQRVLEIGCGAGLLLFRIAPHCVVYDGTDFSAVALSYVRKVLSDSPHARGFDHVQLRQQLADDFNGIEPRSYDTVVLNSVIQYFPDVDYLLRVLAGAIDAVVTGGRIFIGDVRSLPLLRVLHTTIELDRAADAMTVDELRSRVDARVNAEQELVLDPRFFHALRSVHSRISHVDVQLKRGRSHNELSAFRYDVELHIADPPGQSRGQLTPPLEWHHSRAESVRNVLIQQTPDRAIIRDVANVRLTQAITAAQWLQQADASATVGALRRAVPSDNAGIDPEDWFRLGSELGYAVSLDWSASTPDGRYTALLWRAGPDATWFDDAPTVADMVQRPWAEYASHPSNTLAHRDLTQAVRAFAEKRLPEYMVPTSFVQIAALPRTPNGKLDRQALWQLENAPRRAAMAYVPPASDTEEKLAQIWSDVLNVERVGIRNDFFRELGGHSLLATRLVLRIRDAFYIDLPLRCVFEAPTVERLARIVDDTPKRSGTDRSSAIPRLRRELYRIPDPQTHIDTH